MKLIAILTILLIILGILENYFNYRNLKKIPIRILVNGTRGKTSVTKLLTTTFQTYGISTIAKTTGSQALVVERDGKVVPFIRKRGSRLTELIPFIRYCANEKVECIIVECMALRLENQAILAKRILRPTHVLITNSYVDHIAEIGNTIDKTTYTLSQSVPKQSHLFINGDFNLKYISKDINITKSELVGTLDNFSENFNTFPENISLSASVANNFNIPLDFLEKASYRVILDIGMHQKFICPNGAVFFSSFSANDITSLSKTINNNGIDKYNSINFIFNNRLDRQYRVKQFSNLLKSLDIPLNIFIIGENSKMISRYFRKNNKTQVREISDILILRKIMDKCDNNTVFIGIGNIKGQGTKLIQTFTGDQK